MAITKEKVVDVITVDERAFISYREATRVIDDDGTIIGERHTRTTVAPGDPKTGHPRMVKDVMDALHTPERIAEYAAFVEAAKADRPRA